jgi:hypothetical protein
MATETLNIVITTKAEGDGAKKTENTLKGMVKAAKAFAGVAIAKKVAEFAVEMTKLGAAAQTAELRFERFSGGTERAEKFLTAFNRGTQNTVDRMTAMSSAARLLQMGLVGTTDEMEQIASMATKLGNQTMSAGDRISDFAALLANQSIPRLDNFGISSGKVRERIKELQAAIEGLSREEAFKMAVMEQGAIALGRLGDTSETTSTKLDKLSAAWKDTKNAAAEAVATVVDATGALDRGGEGARTYADSMRVFTDTLGDLKDGVITWRDIGRATVTSMRDGTAAGEQHLQILRDLGRETIDAARGQEYLSGEYDRAIPKQRLLIQLTDDSAAAHDQYQRALEWTERALDDTARAALELAEAEHVALQATVAHEEYLFNAAISFTDFNRRREQSAEDYATRVEDLEQEHQDKLTELAERAQARRVRVDEEGVALSIRIAQGKLDALLKKQSEFNDKTTDLERAKTEAAIRNLEGEITEKTGMLQLSHDGYLVMKGENVDNLIAEENRQYEEELKLLEASRQEQEAEQQRSLGRMILNHFNAWVEMNLATDGFTDEEARFVSEMRKEIATDYGLLEIEQKRTLDRMERDWGSTFNQMTGDANAFFNTFMREFNNLPSEHIIRIRTELSGPPVDTPPKGNVDPSPPSDGGTKLPTDPIDRSKERKRTENIPEGSSALTLGNMGVMPGFPVPGGLPGTGVQPGPGGFLPPGVPGIQPGLGGWGLPPGVQPSPGAWGLPGTGIQPGLGGFFPPGGGVQPGPGAWGTPLPPGVQPGPGAWGTPLPPGVQPGPGGFPLPGGGVQPGPGGFPPGDPRLGGGLPPSMRRGLLPGTGIGIQPGTLPWTLPPDVISRPGTGGTPGLIPGPSPGGLPGIINPPGTGGTPGEIPGRAPGGTPEIIRPGRGGTGSGQYGGCNITINVYTNDPLEIARALENYMRLRGASSTSMVGH